MQPTFRQAKIDELTTLWKIFEHAIKKRAEDGSSQWQDGYPSIISIENDILQGNGYVLTEDKTIIGYCSLTENEPAYDAIEGRWFKSRKDLIFHRVAISPDFLGKGFSHKILDCIEQFALSNGCDSIKADTNFDNHAMIGLFEKRNYLYCGEVYFRGSPRRAYQKILI